MADAVRRALPTDKDLDAILAVQALSYPPALQESRDTFRAIVALGCSWMATAPTGDVAGYLLAHPTQPGSVHRLGEAPDIVDECGGHLFVHDLCVAPHRRREGVARALLRASLAAGGPVELVALPEAVRFWEHQGFRPAEPPIAVDPAAFGGVEGTVFMRRRGVAPTTTRMQEL